MSVTPVKKTKLDINTKSITDLSNEVIEKSLLIYVSSADVKSFGNTNRRFQAIANRVLESRGKSKLLELVNYNISHQLH